MEIFGIALRDVLLVLSGLAGIYFVIMLLRLVQIGRHRRADVTIEPDEAAAELPTFTEPVVPPEEPAASVHRLYTAPSPEAAPAPEAPSFGAELARSHVERELYQLRDEVARLRQEVGDLKAAQRVSPQYADAMTLAQRGLTAQDVADRCNISLGEAELVWALARGPSNFDQEDDDGGEPGYPHARSA